MADQAAPTLVYAEKATPFGLLGAAALLHVQYAAKPDASLGKDREPELVFEGGCVEWACPDVETGCWKRGLGRGGSPGLRSSGPRRPCLGPIRPGVDGIRHFGCADAWP